MPGKQQTPTPAPEHTLVELRAVLIQRRGERFEDWERVPAAQRPLQIVDAVNKLHMALQVGELADPLAIEKRMVDVFEEVLLTAAKLGINLNETIPLVWDLDDRSSSNVDFIKPEEENGAEETGEKETGSETET